MIRWIRHLKESCIPENLMTAIFVVGLLLRFRQYMCGRSLWIDEAALAVNFVGRSFSELLLPLKYQQMAPLGFVMFEKLAVVLLGPWELALRFFPLVASMAAMVIFYRLIVKLLEPQAAVVGLLIFAIHQPFIYFASEVKQYSFEVAAAVGVLWLALRILERPPQNISQVFIYGAAGAVALWFSLTSVFVLTAMALVLGWNLWQRNEARGPLLAVLCLWSLSFLLSYGFIKPQMTSSLNTHLQEYWKNSFMPLTPSWKSLKWYAWNFLHTFQYPGGFLLSALAGFACMAGIVSLILRKKCVMLALVIGPIVVTLLASAVRVYPFADRLILFLVPFLIILIAEGVIWIKRYLDRRHVFLGGGFLTLLLLFPVAASLVRAVVPITREEGRPVIDYVRKFGRPSDTIYVYNGSRKAFDYYSSVRPLVQAAIIGVKTQNNMQAYIQDLKQLQGRSRVWVLFTHDWAGHQPSKSFTLNYLDRMGRRMDEFVVPARGADGLYAQESSVYLYDLSQPFTH